MKKQQNRIEVSKKKMNNTTTTIGTDASNSTNVTELIVNCKSFGYLLYSNEYESK